MLLFSIMQMLQPGDKVAMEKYVLDHRQLYPYYIIIGL